MEDNSILLDISMDALLASLRDLQSEFAETKGKMKDLDDQLKAGEISQEDYANAVNQNTQQQKVLRQEMASVEKQIQNEIKSQRAQEGSLEQLRAQLANLNKQYDSMSGIERMSEEGEKLRERIKGLSDEIQNLEGNTGRWQRNVGNYKSALNGMKDSANAAGLSTQGLDRIMKGLSANPLMTVITVFVAILVKMRDKLSENEKVTASLQQATTSIKPVMEGFSKIVSKLADVFSNVLNWAIEQTIKGIGRLGKMLQSLGKVFGQDWGGALIDYADSMTGVKEATEGAAEATEKLEAAATKANKALEKTREHVQTLVDILENMPKMKKTFDDFMPPKEAADTIEEMAEAYGDLQHFADVDVGDIPDTLKPSFWDQFASSFTANAKEIQSVASSLSSSFSSLSSIYSQMASDESKTEEEREKAARAAKAWSALQIAANSGVAIAKGVADAMDNPWPANIPALATTMAAVLSAIAQAKALASQAYASGGVVGGFRGATMGADDTVASVRHGEMVLNANQQRQLFELANSGGGSNMTASLVAALQAMPAPVLEYSEFARFQSRVVNLNETQRLK